MISLSKKKAGFERLNLTTNLQGISGLIKSPTTAAGHSPTEHTVEDFVFLRLD